MKSDYVLHSNDQLTSLIKREGISTWHALTNYIKTLPYGRNMDRKDLSLVVSNKKGTCSSKHAVLKTIADLNAVPNTKLILGIYKMNTVNTPKIGNVLIENNIDYIPEAHCYLKIKGERFDYTSTTSDFKRIKNDILLEKEIEPQDVVDFKVNFHKAYIKQWIENNDIPFDFHTIWKLREQCIENLSN